ncbi:phosphoribosyltransferase-like protein [Rhizobium johnstonii]|uniref:phosphoribosyltransferase-like protein n=1 Tax=Rhizobium johnstonii TaxID=3019933 RepID=UPI003F9D028F
MRHIPRLSETDAGQQWTRQFEEGPDRTAAAELLDAMLLLDSEQVADSQRLGIEQLFSQRHTGFSSRRKPIALYAEREFAERTVFSSTVKADKGGRPRLRADGPKSVKAVSPRRGAARVGSEGPTAFVISQMVERHPTRYLNHPGPSSIRKRNASVIAIVTDLIGSGTRISNLLEKFWRVPTIRAWWSLGWIRFAVIGCAATKVGLQLVRNHRSQPVVITQYTVPTIEDFEPAQAKRWEELIQNYGPEEGRGAEAVGFAGVSALVAFTYRIPNNTPAIVHASGGGWRSLYHGPVPQTTKSAFLPLSDEQKLENSVEASGLRLRSAQSAEETKLLLVLAAVRGRVTRHSLTELSERSFLATKEVDDALLLARKLNLLSDTGRLTDNGHAFLQASIKRQVRGKEVPTNEKPYYPWSLREPRVLTSSVRRSSERPR